MVSSEWGRIDRGDGSWLIDPAQQGVDPAMKDEYQFAVTDSPISNQ
jgi:hypothetical protein